MTDEEQPVFRMTEEDHKAIATYILDGQQQQRFAEQQQKQESDKENKGINSRTLADEDFDTLTEIAAEHREAKRKAEEKKNRPPRPAPTGNFLERPLSLFGSRK